ncbi:hypothetical protein [Sphingobacterium multivorum]|nr:hypothetical protein [Sphingobacterium multivorum]
MKRSFSGTSSLATEEVPNKYRGSTEQAPTNLRISYTYLTWK